MSAETLAPSLTSEWPLTKMWSGNWVQESLGENPAFPCPIFPQTLREAVNRAPWVSKWTLPSCGQHSPQCEGSFGLFWGDHTQQCSGLCAQGSLLLGWVCVWCQGVNWGEPQARRVLDPLNPCSSLRTAWPRMTVALRSPFSYPPE